MNNSSNYGLSAEGNINDFDEFIKKQENDKPPKLSSIIADILDLSPAEVHDTMTFYGFFRGESDRLGVRRLWVCRSLACALRGADDLLAKASDMLGVPVGGTTADGSITLELAECLGACEGAPACMVDDEHIHDIADESKMLELIGRLRATAPNPAAGN